jgi:hypothetical protein
MVLFTVAPAKLPPGAEAEADDEDETEADELEELEEAPATEP